MRFLLEKEVIFFLQGCVWHVTYNPFLSQLFFIFSQIFAATFDYLAGNSEKNEEKPC